MEAQQFVPEVNTLRSDNVMIVSRVGEIFDLDAVGHGLAHQFQGVLPHHGMILAAMHDEQGAFHVFDFGDDVGIGITVGVLLRGVHIAFYGLEPANVQIGFRIDAGTGSQDVLLAEMVDAVLMNGSCGIIDENINQKQLAQYAASGVSDMNDYAYFRLIGMPKQGQTLEQLKDLLLKQIEILKSGNWDADLLTAAINNRKLSNMKSLESNSNRAMAMAMAYLAHQNWQDVINETENMSLVTKEDVIDFAKRVFKNNNYVVVYKRQGEQRNVQKVDKPEITPVVMNRDVESGFLKNIIPD